MNKVFAEPRQPWAGRCRSRAAPAARMAPIVVSALLLLAGGCAQRDPNRTGLFEPYRTDLPQGNYLTRETLEQVKEGMSREQVRFALGTPLLRHTFHPDRWDYVFRYQFPNGRAELRRATVIFRDDRVAAVETESLPTKEDPSDPALPGYRPPTGETRASQ